MYLVKTNPKQNVQVITRVDYINPELDTVDCWGFHNEYLTRSELKYRNGLETPVVTRKERILNGLKYMSLPALVVLFSFVCVIHFIIALYKTIHLKCTNPAYR